MFRRPQPENFVNYQLQASLGRTQQGGKIPIKRRKKTRIKKEKRTDSFLLRSQDIDKRRSAYRPDRLLAFHQSSLNNATRDANEVQRGLTAIGTTIQSERDQKRSKALEDAKGRVLTAIAQRLESKEPLFGYAQHRQPDDFNAIRLPDREQQKPKELGYKEPRPQPELQLEFSQTQTSNKYASHRKPEDLNRQVEPLLQEEPIEEPIEDVTDQTPIPRTEKPKVGKLDPSRTQALEGLSFQVADANDPRVKQAEQNAQTQRNIERRNTQRNEPQLRQPQPEPEPEPEPLREVPEPQTTTTPKTITINKPTEVPPTEFQPLSEGTQVKNLDEEGMRQGLAVAKAKERRKTRMAERFSQLSENIQEDRIREFDEFEQPEPQPETNLPEPQAGGQVEEEKPEGLDWLQTHDTKIHGGMGAKNNVLLTDTYSFVDTDGKVGKGKRFEGKRLSIVGINRGGNVLVQLTDTIGKGKVDGSVRGNIAYDKLVTLVENGLIDLKPQSRE